MKLSITVVTYNHENYINECLESILNQEVDFEYEIIIGEDCSEDKTRNILLEYKKKYPNRIKLLLHEVNIGPQNNFASVINACSGEYVAYIDGDDVMLPGKLKKQVDFLDRNQDYSVVSHNMRVFDSATGKTLYFFNKPNQKDTITIDDLVQYGTIFCHSSKMYRRSATPSNGVCLETQYVGDWLFHIQNASFGKVGYLNEVLGEYRKHQLSVTASKSRMKNAFLDQEYTLNKSKGLVKEDVLNYGYARLLYSHASYYLDNNLKQDFMRAILKSGKEGIFVNLPHQLYYKYRNVFFIPKIIRFFGKRISNIVRSAYRFL